jgi:hypothetical protein
LIFGSGKIAKYVENVGNLPGGRLIDLEQLSLLTLFPNPHGF